MRIVTNTPDLLIIEERPWFWGAFFVVVMIFFIAVSINALDFGARFVGAVAMMIATGSAGMLTAVVERVWLVFDRTAGTVELRRRNMRRYRRDTYALSDLADTGVVVESARAGSTSRLSLSLASQSAPVPVTGYFQVGPGAYRCAEAARTWLASALGSGGNSAYP